MSQIRHSELFASQDWQVLYRAFSQINFNATDPASINQALREYIKINYPEDFNDWIESSEFVAIIDLLSWLAGTLAFKIDINARENFLETAQSRESVLRLARFLSYNPSRARPASGLVKIMEVMTDDDVTDANGKSISGQSIRWNNADDRDWFEKFTTVLNAAFVSTNPFGTPLKNGSIGDVNTYLYRLNGRMRDNDFRFNARVGGKQMDFEVCNLDFDEDGGFNEREPNGDSAFHVGFRSDGNGNSSANTGFFMMFKQGLLKTQTFNISSPVENYVINVDSQNVAEDEVWVQSVNQQNQVLKTWKKVPTLYSENITFNNIPRETRDLYSVITRENDSISIRFSDGYFGTAPTGNISVSYRNINGEKYTINPLDISRGKLTFTYINRRGLQRKLTMIFALYTPVRNSTTRETDAQIKKRAPGVYSTQGRMVSGEDYNLFPLSSNLAVKLKAVNRIYAGHTRHLDLNDPTSTYQDTTVFSDDGIIFEEAKNHYVEIPISLNRSSSEIVSQYIKPVLKRTEVRYYLLSKQIERALDDDNPYYVQPPLGEWRLHTTNNFSSTGYLTNDYAHAKKGAMFLFEYPDGRTRWNTLAEVNGNPSFAPENITIPAPIVVDEAVPDHSTILAVVPAYVSTISELLYEDIRQKIELGQSLSLWFDPSTSSWVIHEYSPISQDNHTPPLNRPSAIKMVSIEQIGNSLWKISAKGQTIVFESERKIHWYADNEKVIDSFTGTSKTDTVNILGINTDIDDTNGLAIKTPSVFNTSTMYYSRNGSHEPRRVHLKLVDDDEDGGYDNPDAFYRLISSDEKKKTLFWRIDTNGDFKPVYNVHAFSTELKIQQSVKVEGKVAYCVADDTFFTCVSNTWVSLQRRDFRVAKGRGKNIALSWTDDNGVSSNETEHLSFQWKHYANTQHRIDPSRTNIIDIFVLSNEYDFETRQWIANGSDPENIPIPPTELDLRLLFKGFEEYKMFTDELVWRPVRYKLLFGSGAEQTNLRAKFKVVKLSNTPVSDGEIKSRVVRAINDFFDISRWDFGETFYFTELAAYVHQQLATVIGSFVIVPQNEEASFGDVFEATAAPDEIFISTAQVADVEIISSNTSGNLRIR